MQMRTGIDQSDYSKIESGKRYYTFEQCKRIALALAMCAVCVLAFGATLAQASIDSGMGGTNELQVNVIKPESDVQNAGAKANVYRVASASKDATYDTYNYTFDVAAFSELGNGFDRATMTSDSWIRMAETAKAPLRPLLFLCQVRWMPMASLCITPLQVVGRIQIPRYQ